MAYQAGTFSNISNMMSILRVFVTGNGYTEDEFTVDGTGHRFLAHRGTEYINIRSGVAEAFFTGSALVFTGFGINGSRGYAIGSAWDEQPGVGNITGEGGTINGVDNGAGGDYRLFSSNSGDQIFAFIECSDQTRQLAFGLTDIGIPFYMGSGSSGHNELGGTSVNILRSSFFMNTPQAVVTGYPYSGSAYVDGQWTDGDGVNQNTSTIDANGLIRPVSHVYTSATSQSVRFQYPLGQQSFFNSPNLATPNPILVPSHLMWYTAALDYKYLGSVPDLYIVNTALQYSEGDEITLGGDVYSLSLPFFIAGGDFGRFGVVVKK